MGYRDIKFDKDSVFLVTGGAGFIGSNLCEAIIEKGYNVRCFDKSANRESDNIAHLKINPAFEFITGDIRDYETCSYACRGVDFILHHAAYGSPGVADTPLLYEEVNIKGTLNMMEAAKQAGAKKFVYMSSASVYGADAGLPKKEEKTGNLLSMYALTKRINEQYGQIYADLYGLETYGLRCFNVFGRRQSDLMIPKFIKLLLNGESPVISGDGSQTRDYIYIDDVICANLKACQAPREAAGQVYNIACGKGTSIIYIYDKLCELLNKDTKPVFGEERQSDIKHSYADISKAEKLLDWKPEWSFERGIEEAAEWYKINYSKSEV
jgi:UDP-N-acetylglucosamine 4-epimerase